MVEGGNVYQRLAAVRAAFREEPAVMTGRNEKTSYEYLERADFMPRALDLFKENGLFSYLSFNKEVATLTILIIDSPADKIVFESPMSTANERGLHPCQNLGWAQTYIGRRLYITALELNEADPVDRAVMREKKDPRESLEAPDETEMRKEA